MTVCQNNIQHQTYQPNVLLLLKCYFCKHAQREFSSFIPATYNCWHKRMPNCKYSKIIISLRENTEIRRIQKGEDYMQWQDMKRNTLRQQKQSKTLNMIPHT